MSNAQKRPGRPARTGPKPVKITLKVAPSVAAKFRACCAGRLSKAFTEWVEGLRK